MHIEPKGWVYVRCFSTWRDTAVKCLMTSPSWMCYSSKLTVSKGIPQRQNNCQSSHLSHKTFDALAAIMATEISITTFIWLYNHLSSRWKWAHPTTQPSDDCTSHHRDGKCVQANINYYCFTIIPQLKLNVLTFSVDIPSVASVPGAGSGRNEGGCNQSFQKFPVTQSHPRHETTAPHGTQPIWTIHFATETGICAIPVIGHCVH